jgi:predicted lipoprotein with Yx(FWY)xxD motif
MRPSTLALASAAVAIAITGCGSSSTNTATTSGATASDAAASGATTSNAAASSAAAYGAATATTASAAVAVANTAHGPALVGSGGRALYLFEKDTGTASSCSGECATAWQPLVVSATPTAGTGVAAAKLGTTKRSDGQTQVTYDGHPLYYYVRDTAPGQITGEGLQQFGGGWDLVSPAGKKIESGG